MPRTRHTISGVIDENTPEHIVTHPVLGQYLEVVDEGAKPFVPALHRPATVPVEVAQEKDAPAVEKAPAETASTPEKNGNDR